MAAPDDRRYLESHEWHKLEGDTVTIGITQFAADELTDVTFVEFLKDSGPIKAGETFGEVESVKTTSELYSGVDGEIVETNQEVADSPGLINEDPFNRGWLIKVKPSDPAQLEKLMDASAYNQQVGQ
jgi:glycine cleavage system H protein